MGLFDHLELPALTALSCSGGKQSSAILWMVILGEIQVDKDRFIALFADPGMENPKTYAYIKVIFEAAKKNGIRCGTVSRGNLYRDLVENKDRDYVMLPPYWVEPKKGSREGRLKQRCTEEYKIRPMVARIREELKDMYGVGLKNRRLPEGFVEQWIGFTMSEVERVKPPRQKYINMVYPLIDLRMTNEDVVRWYSDRGLPMPPRSVCEACFANGVEFLYKMWRDRPASWEKVVRVDDSIRDLSHLGVRNRAYVNRTKIPARELGAAFEEVRAKLGDRLPSREELNKMVGEIRDIDDADDFSCDSGYCFV